MSDTLTKLLADVKADGTVDSGEVVALRSAILADGVVDRDEAESLFELNDFVTGAENDPSYTTFMVDSIVSHVLDDETSPGVLDQEEADWLVSKIEGDGQVDAVEKAIVAGVLAKATSVPASFTTKATEWGVNVSAAA